MLLVLPVQFINIFLILGNQNAMWKPTPESLAIWKKFTTEKPSGRDQRNKLVLCLEIQVIQESFCHHATTTLARSSFNMDNFAAYEAAGN